jgi:HEAT repeat protein
MNIRDRLLPFVLSALAYCALLESLAADVLVHADGRRTEGKDPRVDNRGGCSVEVEGRRVVLAPGEVVATIDAEGRETDFMPKLAEGPLDPALEAALARVGDPRDDNWAEAALALQARPHRAIHDGLVALAASGKAELRLRALTALAWLRTRESVVAAAERVLAEKDPKTRFGATSALYAAQEVYRRADTAALTQAGLVHADKNVRIDFALLAPLDVEAAVPVLQKDGLRSSDHHVRESAAVALGKRGDGSGEKILREMLARKTMPGVDDPELGTRLLVEEQTELCEILGKLGSKTAVGALEKALRSPHEAVRAAARKALDARTQGADGGGAGHD